MKRFTFTPLAASDLDDIAAYLRTLPAGPATRIGRELRDDIYLVAKNPHLGRVDSELTLRWTASVFRFVSGAYVLYYIEVVDGVQFIGVLHARRNRGATMEQRST